MKHSEITVIATKEGFKDTDTLLEDFISSHLTFYEETLEFVECRQPAKSLNQDRIFTNPLTQPSFRA
jgi:hypothetical protein